MSESDNKSCGCCEPAVDADAPSIENRPALSAVEYRIREYGTFRRAMIEAIPSKTALANWTARDETDYGIALIDMWAYLGDILTFYQERIANEAFLRTAVHRESVRRLAALLDYRPAPGAAAVAYVAFTLEKGKTLQVPIGLRLQSVPGQNEKPQKFETVEAIAADAALNLVRVHGVPVAFEPFPTGAKESPLASAEIPKVGTAPLASGAPLAIFDHLGMELKTVTSVTTDGEVGRVAWQPAIARGDFSRITTRAAATGRSFAIFGSDTPAKTLVSEVTGTGPLNAGIQWTEHTTNFALPEASEESNIIPLDRAVPDLKAGTRVLLVRAADDTSAAAVRFATIANAGTKPQVMTGDDAGELPNYSGNVTELTLDLRVVSPPVIVREGTATDLTTFVVAEDGAIWSYASWSSLGGTTFTDVAACNAAGTDYVFGRDASGTLWQNDASGWTELGTELDLVRAGVAADRPYVIARGSDGRARIRQREAFGWREWTAVGKGPKCDSVATIVNAAGAIEVFVRRAGVNDVWTTRQTAPGGPWMPWTNLGDSVLDVTAAMNVDGSVEVFTRRQNSELGRRRRTGNAWSPWVLMGGWIDQMTVASDRGKRLNIFARGNDGKVCTRRQTVANALTWTDWTACAGSPVVESLAAISDNIPIVFVVHEGKLRPFASLREWGQYGVPMWPIADRRLVSVLDLTSDPLPIAAKAYPSSITASPITVPLAQLPSIEVGRTIILDDASRIPHTATVTAATTDSTHLTIAFSPDLSRPLDDAGAVLYGNVANVTHGETQASQVLGNGDAASRFQTFTVAKSPVTHVLEAGGRNGVASTLEVRVDGVRWSEAATLLDRGSDERVYVTDIDEKNVMTVRFGGDPGARLTTGRNNVTAKYRVGLGSEGNVRAGVLTNLLDRPVGLKGVTNPDPASGGAAAETIDGIRENAPNTVRTFGRIVSLRDFEDAAREHASVAKARATWTMLENERVVRLTVAAEGGSPLTSTALALIVEDLDARRDANRPMHVRPHANVPFSIQAVVQVKDDYLLEDVQARAAEALAKFFSFDERDLGEPVHLSAVYAALQSVDGVVAVNVTRLRRRSGGTEVGDHILIQAYEIASLASASDAVVKTQYEAL